MAEVRISVIPHMTEVEKLDGMIRASCSTCGWKGYARTTWDAAYKDGSIHEMLHGSVWQVRLT